MTYLTKYTSPIGTLTIASDGQYITGLWLDGQNHFGTTITQPTSHDTGIPVLQAAKQWLDSYFAGLNPATEDLPVFLDGTPFQMEVWEILAGIPYGNTVTYGEIAAMLAAKRGIRNMSAQAVGNAVGKNPVSIIIPCHRVMGEGGKLTGYAGGTARKKYLLDLEANSMRYIIKKS